MTRDGTAIVQRLAANSLFVTVSLGITTVAGLVVSVMLARFLGPTDYGQYSFMMWLIGILALIANLGLGNTAVRFVAEYRVRDITVAVAFIRNIISIQLAVSLFLALLLSTYGVLFSSDPWLFILAAGVMVPMVLYRLASSIVSGLQKYDVLTIVGAITTPIQIILFVVALVKGGGVLGILTVIIGIELLKLVLCYRFVDRQIHQDGPIAPGNLDREEIRRVFGFASTIFLLSLLDSIVWEKSEVFFLKWFWDLDTVAFYSIAFGLTFMLYRLPATISNVLLPTFSEAVGADDQDVLTKGFYVSTKYLCLLASAMGVWAFVISPELIAILYGPLYADAVPVFRLLVAAGSIVACARPGSSILLGTEHHKFVLRITAILAIINIALDVALIPLLGAMGAAMANSLVQISGIVVGLTFVLWRLHFPFPTTDVLKIYGSAIFAGGMIHLMGNFLSGNTYFVISIFAFTGFYVMALRLVRPWSALDQRIFAVILEKIPRRLQILLCLVQLSLGVESSRPGQ